MPKPTLSHIDQKGRARMVDVGNKPTTQREAIAEGSITLMPSTLAAIADDEIPKGEVLATARIAGILAAKRCDSLIPLCHSLPLDSIEISFDLPELSPADEGPVQLRIKAIARVSAKTGVEMEALTAVAVAALTVYDMCKAIDKTMVIGGIKLLKKTGGSSDKRRVKR